MRNKVVQLSLFDTYTDVLDKMEDHKSELIELLEKYIDFDAIIPQQFYYSYYCSYGRKRINPLESFIRALFLQKLLGMKQNNPSNCQHIFAFIIVLRNLYKMVSEYALYYLQAKH